MNQTTKILQNSNKSDGHILVVSSHLQGHAAPLLKLSHQITKFGSKVSFLTTDFTRERMLESMNDSDCWNHGIQIISIPDGLKNEDERKDQKKLYNSVHKVMGGYLEDLLNTTNRFRSTTSNEDRITGVVIDSPLAFMSGIPKKMGIKIAIFWCSTPGCLALGLKIPQLIETKFIDKDGTPLVNEEKIHLLPNMPAMTNTDLLWYFPGDINIQKDIFRLIKDTIHHLQNADWIICNWFHELVPSASNLIPNLLSVGPLLANGLSSGSFCTEDSTCLTWLDKQSKSSVVYVAFGSTSRYNQQQLDELANGLESMGHPFLWVAWSGLSNGAFPTYSNEFKERVANRGKIVEWAPQELVLSHPSIACFITHCGWSSFLESLSMGVPLLCWPYFGDQLYTQTCICDSWRVGMLLKPDENGIISRYEIMHKVDQLLLDGNVRENVQKLKEIATKSISKGGSSSINLEYLVEQMKC
ncbi:hypothetical protein ACJIZ3_008886 [Penstemon smallii]|uniref:Glycosyltransferase n=1 Tax=Penstemon smallii TaxID=265156 RepID=A0ABD3TBU9_9LAMI